MTIFNQYLNRYAESKEEEFTLQEYLDICKNDPSAYATAAERMLMAIGEPELVDTRQDPRLSRLFSNKVIKIYPAFKDFYGMEETIEKIVSYFRHAAQGLEEKKQILYRRQVIAGRKAEVADGTLRLLCHQGLTHQRVTAGTVFAGRRRCDPG